MITGPKKKNKWKGKKEYYKKRKKMVKNTEMILDTDRNKVPVPY